MKRDTAQRKAILVLEKRLRAVESAQQARPAAPTPAPAPPTVEPPAPTEVQPPAQFEAPTEERVAEDEPVKKAPEPVTSLEAAKEAEGVALAGTGLTFEPGFRYARFDRASINLSGFLALDAIFLGQISVDEVETEILTWDFTTRYGITDRLQVDANVPLVYRFSNFRSGGVGGVPTALSEIDLSKFDLGDVSFGASYRLIEETRDWPEIIVTVRGDAPTGTSPFGIETVTDPTNSNLIVPEELPTGDGVWGVSGGLTFVKTVDPVVVFANARYFERFSRRFSDVSSATGDQPGTVDPGNAIELGGGAAFALNERMSMTFSYSQRLIDDTFIELDGGERTKIIGSDANVGVVNMGLTWAFTDTFSMTTNVGFGVTSDAADVDVSLRFPYRF